MGCSSVEEKDIPNPNNIKNLNLSLNHDESLSENDNNNGNENVNYNNGNNISLTTSSNNIKVVWFDENIKDNQIQIIIKQLEPLINSCSAYDNLKEGFSHYYSDSFSLIFTIVSGKLWGRYLQFFMKNINKIINIPYVIIFTSERFKNILLQEDFDEMHTLSYDTLNKINDPFYNQEE